MRPNWSFMERTGKQNRNTMEGVLLREERLKISHPAEQDQVEAVTCPRLKEIQFEPFCIT
jgi:hypothetical protein